MDALAPDSASITSLRDTISQYALTHRHERHFGMEDRALLTIPQPLLHKHMHVLLPESVRAVIRDHMPEGAVFDGVSLVEAPAHSRLQRVHKDHNHGAGVMISVVYAFGDVLHTWVRPGSHTTPWDPKASKSREGMVQVNSTLFAYDTCVDHCGAATVTAAKNRLFMALYSKKCTAAAMDSLREMIAMHDRVGQLPYFEI